MRQSRALYRRLHEALTFRLRSLAGGRFAHRCRPASVMILLTDRCNARCVHCDIRKNRGREVCPTLEQWRTVLDDLRSWLGPIHVVCQVSRWQEAFGWAIAEAMAFRKPVVATRVGGIPEIVEPGVTGYLAERGDARQIADYILSLLRDPEMSRRMGAAGRAAVEENFDLQKNVAKLIQLYGIP